MKLLAFIFEQPSYIYQMQFYGLKSLFISMKICIVVTDVVMTLLIPAESVM